MMKDARTAQTLATRYFNYGGTNVNDESQRKRGRLHRSNRPLAPTLSRFFPSRDRNLLRFIYIVFGL